MGKGICMNKLKQMETALSPGGGQQAVDQMDNQTLLLRYKETGDMELKWALVLRYTDLVRRIAIQTCGLFSGFTQLDDVIHEGILVLLSETAFSNLMSFEVLLDTYGNVTGKALSGNPPEDAYQQKELHEVLRRGIASLRENERLVLSLYYEKELTMKEIAQVLGVSAPRISQIHNRAIQRLQAYMKQYIGA